MKLSLRKEESKVVEQPNKSHFQAMFEDLSAAHQHMSNVGNHLSALMLMSEKAANYIERFRRECLEAAESAGGTISEVARIEEQIADFVPKNVRADGQAKEV